MSHEIETIDLEDDVLDYEMDDEMGPEPYVEMGPEQEDTLLNEDNCVAEEHDDELVRKMSLTSVSSIDPLATVTPNEPLPMPPQCLSTNELWGQSLSTYANVLQTSAADPSNKAIEAQASLDKQDGDVNQLQPPVIDVFPPVRPTRDVIVDEPKSECKLIDVKVVASTSPDPEGMHKSDGLTCTSSSSSTPTSSSIICVKRNKNKSKKRRFVKRNALLKGFGPSKHPLVSIQSLMSINTQLPFPRTRFASIISADVPTPTNRTKIPFIIKTQTDGGSISRTVTVNPEFEGLPSTKVSATMYNRSRRISGVVNNLDLRNVVINKRRSTTSLESIGKSDEIATDPTPSAALPMSMDMSEMSDDDKKYLMAIEEQKKKREEVLRQKEWKRDMEGWQFLGD